MRCMLLMYRDEKWWDAKSEEERGAIRQLAVEASEVLRAGGHSIEVRPIRELPPR